MNKPKFPAINGVYIYPLEYLQNEELTETDLNYLFDTKSLLYSLIIGMFKFASYNFTDDHIIDIINNDKKWVYKYYFIYNKHKQFTKILVNIFKNLYYYSDKEALDYAQLWMIYYGFGGKKNNIDE